MNYTWIFVYFLFGIVNGNLEQCALLAKPLILKDDINVCDPKSGVNLGNSLGHCVTLDFSQAKNDVLDKFLGQNFKKIIGSIVMEENSQVDHINFAKVGIWDGSNVLENDIFINIRNNPKLTKFEWDSTVKAISINPGTVPVYVLMYNNPLLNAESLKMIKDAITSNLNFKGHIQNEPGECFFGDPFDNKKYLSPIPEILENCRIIKGDFILDGGKLKEKLKLVDGGCLRLTGVDMSGVTVEASPGTGVDICKDGTTKSEITGNSHLCGQELKKLAEYFPAGSAVKIEMNPGTCTIECKSMEDVADKYNYCKTITTAASISDWFTNGDLKEKASHLVSAEELTVSGGSMAKISLPKLTETKGLIIQNNAELTDLELPVLNTVSNLVVEGNSKLTLATINKALSKIDPTTSTVECRLTESDIIKDIKDLRFCSTVIGPLTLEGLKDFDKAKFNVKKIEGCVKIQNTKLRSLSFLDIDISGCAEQHLVTGDNPNLCKVDHLDSQKKIPVTFEGKYIDGGGTSLDANVSEDSLLGRQGYKTRWLDFISVPTGSFVALIMIIFIMTASRSKRIEELTYRSSVERQSERIQNPNSGSSSNTEHERMIIDLQAKVFSLEQDIIKNAESEFTFKMKIEKLEREKQNLQKRLLEILMIPAPANILDKLKPILNIIYRGWLPPSLREPRREWEEDWTKAVPVEKRNCPALGKSYGQQHRILHDNTRRCADIFEISVNMTEWDKPIVFNQMMIQDYLNHESHVDNEEDSMSIMMVKLLGGASCATCVTEEAFYDRCITMLKRLGPCAAPEELPAGGAVPVARNAIGEETHGREAENEMSQFAGQLVFNATTQHSPKKRKNLKRILGGLKIDKSPAESLDFPNLEEIQASDAMECQNDADIADKYNFCKTITTAASITDWFTNEDLKEKANHLVSAEELTISGGSMTKISLPKLINAKGLIIKNNAELTDLDLPALNTVANLVIEGNPKLTLATINKALSKIEPTTSTVECRLTESDVIKDIKDLRLCSTIIGPLTLEGVEDFDEAKKALKHLKTILGGLKIDKSPAESIEFPNLEEIQAPTAPALQITNNPALKSLTMKKLPKITVDDGTKPAIKITGNKQLKQETLKQFLKLELYDDCVKKTGNCEYVDSVERVETVESTESAEGDSNCGGGGRKESRALASTNMFDILHWE